MLRIVVVFIGMLILNACSQKEEKVIDLSDRIPKSKRNYDYKDTADVVTDSSRYYIAKFKPIFPEVEEVKKIDANFLMDRFRPTSSEKYMLYFNEREDSVQFTKWRYRDSIVTKSAFYNWLDHEDVSYFGANENITKEAFSMIYSDTILLTVSGSVDHKAWRKITEEQKWLKEGAYLLEQRLRSKTKWYQFTEEEFIEIHEE